MSLTSRILDHRIASVVYSLFEQKPRHASAVEVLEAATRKMAHALAGTVRLRSFKARRSLTHSTGKHVSVKTSCTAKRLELNVTKSWIA